jgi:hypothetical protein
LLEDEVSASESESTSGEDTDIDKPSALEEIQCILAAAWIPSGIIELARLQVAELLDTGTVQLFQPPPQRQRNIVNPLFENPVVRVFGGDDDTVGTVESDASMSSSDNLPSIDVHLPSEMKVPMSKYNFADFIVNKEHATVVTHHL